MVLLTCDEAFVPQNTHRAVVILSAGWPAVTGLFVCPSLFSKEKPQTVLFLFLYEQLLDV